MSASEPSAVATKGGTGSKRKWMRRVGCLVTIATVVPVASYLGFLWADKSMATDLVRPRNGSLGDPPAELEVPDDVDQVIEIEVGPPNATLQAWVMQPSGDVRVDPVASIILLHGISDSKQTQAVVGRRFAAAGITAVLVDLRGHGGSSTTRLGYGALDVHDLSRVIDHLEEREIARGPWGAYGPSYGGAVALQLAGHDPRIVRALSVGAFATMREEVIAYARRKDSQLGWVPDFWWDRITNEAGRLAGFDPDDASPREAARRTQAQLTILHGTDDEIVPFSQAESIAEACAPRCRFIPLEGKDHLGSLSNEPLRTALRTFFVPTAP